MGIFDFTKDAGASTGAETNLASHLTARMPEMLSKYGLSVENPSVDFDNGAVVVRGEAADRATKEKVVLAIGNIRGVGRVHDEMTIRGEVTAEEEAAQSENESQFYTVKSGDSLSKIAKAHYGDAMKYPVIFEANRPLLDDPNKIYPGQMLRIPQL